MRTKVREFSCHNKTGNDAVVIEGDIQADGIQNKQACCKEFSLADGSPVVRLGGKFEHFPNLVFRAPSWNHPVCFGVVKI